MDLSTSLKRAQMIIVMFQQFYMFMSHTKAIDLSSTSRESVYAPAMPDICGFDSKFYFWSVERPIFGLPYGNNYFQSRTNGAIAAESQVNDSRRG